MIFSKIGEYLNEILKELDRLIKDKPLKKWYERNDTIKYVRR